MLAQLEAAHDLPDGDLRRELLTFTFVGGGYAGVEALAELESLTRDALHLYPRLRPVDLRWVLIEAQSSLLPSLSPKLAQYTLRHLRSRGVQVLLETRLRSCVDKVVEVESPTAIEPYRTGTLVWTTGQRPSSFVMSLGIATDERGRVIVDEFHAVPGHDGVFAIGDAAAVPDPDGGVSPQTAQHAFREGTLAGRNVAAWLGHGDKAPFRYRDRGLAVTLGKRQGVAQVRGLTFSGFIAWWMGRSYHLLMIPGFARKARVVTDWTIALLFPATSPSSALSAPPLPWLEPNLLARRGLRDPFAPRKSAVGEWWGEVLRGPEAGGGLGVMASGAVGHEARTRASSARRSMTSKSARGPAARNARSPSLPFAAAAT